jgi:hypothetical protein
MRKFAYRIAIWWYIRVWSPLYRVVIESGEYRPIKPYNSMDELVKALREVGWHKDGIRQMFDAIGHPKRMQWLISTKTKVERGCDCDEHAGYSHEALSISDIIGLEEVVGILTVGWWKPWFWKFKRFGGHHVCLLKYEGKFAHVGNWGLHTGFETRADAIKHVYRDNDFFGWFLWRFPSKLLDYDVVVR